MKITIAENSDDATKPYKHLQPIVDFLLLNGNKTITPSGFYPTQGGWVCDLRYPINYKEIKKSFTLPKTIHFGVNENSISCEKSWAEIRGNIM